MGFLIGHFFIYSIVGCELVKIENLCNFRSHSSHAIVHIIITFIERKGSGKN